ncbi:Beta-porphyranase A precursor [Planctomycetes bacterium MalM25]|nr:Beta-porphyranase A precursor [Planctomycetes bacterium MalM25]
MNAPPRCQVWRCCCAYLLLAVVSFAAVRRADAQSNVTIHANARGMVGGVKTLDRAQYFNHWGQLTPGTSTNLGDLESEVHATDGLHTFSGRETNDFPAAMRVWTNSPVPENPNNPGFFEHTALINSLQNTSSSGYKNRLLNSSAWVSVRESENPIYVTSGRKSVFPDFLDGGGEQVNNFEGYADFLNVYLEEVVYGTGPGQGYLPMDKDRFYIEIMNEPNWPANTPAQWQDVIDMHREVTELVKEQHPEAKLGGPSCCDDYADGGQNSWERSRQLMDDMASWQTAGGQSVELDFWTIHPYERYDVANDGSHQQILFSSPGRLAAIMDLYDAYSTQKFGHAKPFSITEYGSWNRTNLTGDPSTSADDDYGDYTRPEQQWDLVRDTREKLMVFMNHPDRIVNATPFLGPMWWERQTPTSPAGDNVFWERDAAGVWHETVVASMYRMHNELNGEYLQIENDDPDLQTLAFREGNVLHVMLNNLKGTSNTVNLGALAGLGEVASASIDRVYWNGTQGVYVEDADVSATWSSLQLEPNEGAVLKLTLTGPEVYDQAYDSETYYSDDVEIPVSSQTLISTTITADTEDATGATLRFGYTVPSGMPTFSVRVNGNSFTVTSDDLALDDNDDDLIQREIEVPASMLVDGENEVSFFFPFSTAAGEISAAALSVRRSVGDYNASGTLDAGDINQLYLQFGPAAADDKHDLNEDGTVDQGDLNHWLALRNAVAGDTDVDGDIDTRDAVATIAHLGASGQWTEGNFDGDSDVDFTDLGAVTEGFTGAKASVVEGPVDAGQSVDNPDLLYDPETGGLAIDADGLTLFAFHLSGEGDFIGMADFSDLDGAVGEASTLVDNTPGDIGWVSARLDSVIGFDQQADLGDLAPVGMDLSEFQAWVDDASWAGIAVGGEFDLVLLTAGLTGDFNADGMVDAADYTVWRDTNGSTSDLRADANGDLVVDQDDYQLWRGNYGATQAATLAVPTPHALPLAFTLGATLLAGGARRSESR